MKQVASILALLAAVPLIGELGVDRAYATTSSSTAMTSAQAVPDGFTLIEKVERKGDEIMIPYEKYVMDNGLTVILHEDKSDPLVHVDVTYKVGSAHEEVGKSGFAHFFEHMMFQGSENVEDEQHFKIIQEGGGTMNGTTNNDRTNYFQTVPNNQLERVLWLEADRMGYLLPAVTQEKFEVQRATVKNERSERIDNVPYGLVPERIGEALYPEGHPYSWLPIGYVEDLDRVNVNDLKAFFLQWYGPNNATLTIGGDYDKAQTLAWVKKYFGPIPTAPEVPVLDKAPGKLEEDKYITLEDKIRNPALVALMPTVYDGHPDEAPLDVLASIIGQGRTSLFYKNLIKRKMAVQASAGHSCRQLACEFVIQTVPSSGANTVDMERIIRRSFKEFEKRGVLDDDLTRVKSGITSSLINNLQTVSTRVSFLAAFETFTGNPNLLVDEIARYEAVTKEDVMRVYEQYVKRQPMLFLRVVPEGEAEDLGIPATWEFPGRTLPDFDAMSEADLEYRVAQDNFDRSKMPEPGPAPEIKVPDYWEAELANGIRVLGVKNDEAPRTTISLRTEAGSKDDPYEKLGLASLTGALMNDTTMKSSSEDISNRLSKLGSTVNVGISGMSVSSLTRNLDETMEIAYEKLFEPKFTQTDFDRRINALLQSFKERDQDAEDVAGAVSALIMYGEENHIAHPSSGYEETINAIKIEDIREFYDQHLSPDDATIIITTDLSKDEVLEYLKPLEEWEGPEQSEPQFEPFPELEGGTLYLVDKPEAAQSIIRIMKRAPLFNPEDPAGETYKLRLLNFPLGGSFNSRVNLNLREDKGYTYGANTRFSSGEYTGTFRAGAAVRTDATADSIREFMKEIDNFAQNGMTEEELAFMRSAFTQNDALSYETASQKAGFLSPILRLDLDPDFAEKQSEVVKTVELDELNALAAKHLKTDEMIMVVVGDKKAIMGDLVGLGYRIVELDTQGQPLF